MNPDFDILIESVFNIDCPATFNAVALQVFRYQYENNPVYRLFADMNRRTPESVRTISDIPFLPVELFKSHEIVTGEPGAKGAVTFLSSGTSGSVPSRHTISDPGIYRRSFFVGFELFFGDIEEYDIFALLPSYQEREGSSLIYMVENLIAATGSDAGGFYPGGADGLEEELLLSPGRGRRAMLIGVSYALLDFAASLSRKMPGLMVVETGGMKGRRREMVRQELHDRLMRSFGVERICSEYGMTELCSQAWALHSGSFRTPPWMKVLIRDINDPFSYQRDGKAGGINIIDLANINSCSFIATQDIGRALQDGSFEMTGRMDGSEARGCNLMVD